ncbi:MAG TPA: hypothetical protein VF515_08825 [Candidatus Binatia bacterium]
MSPSAPTAPAVAAWLDFHWTADAPHPVRAWVPHLRPAADDVIADHSFRSPVAAMESGDIRVLLLPDVELLGHERALPAALDLDIGDPRGARLAYGLWASQPYGHTYFRRDPGGGTTQPLCFALHVVAESAAEQSLESSCARWVWRHTGTAPAARARTQALPFAEHAVRASDAVFVDEWVEGSVGGRTVGGPINYSAFGQAVFFQAWFNALRSAIGLALLGKRLHRHRAAKHAVDGLDRGVPDATRPEQSGHAGAAGPVVGSCTAGARSALPLPATSKCGSRRSCRTAPSAASAS